MLFAPMRLFLPSGVLLLVLGAIYSLYIVITVHNGIPAAGILILLAGMLCVMLGLIADQISQFRLTQLPDLTRPTERKE